MPKPLAVVPELEAELDALYALPPDEFTSARNDLARRLKQAGQDDAEARVKSLRKPTMPVWAVNQLARRNPEGIEALLAAGARLRAAQEEALRGGESSALREATATERTLLRELTQQADEVLRGAAHGSAGKRIGSTLRAAALSTEAGQLLRRGWLGDELEPSGFDAFAGMKVPAAAAKPKKPPPPPQRRRREEQERKLRQRAAKLRDEATQAAREVAEAEAALERARKNAARSEEAAARAEARLEEPGRYR